MTAAADRSPKPRSLLIVDDHPVLRVTVRELAQAVGLTVIAEAGDGASALAAVTEHHPDIVLLDIHLPGPDGITIAHRIATLPTPPTVILMSADNPETFGARLTHAPIHGFIPKQRLDRHTLTTILP